MKPGAEPLYDTVLMGDKEIKIENNIALPSALSKKATWTRLLPRPTSFVEGTFNTPKVYHSQMETKSVVCRPEAGRRHHGLGRRRNPSTTCASCLGQIFDIPLSKIDVQRMPMAARLARASR